MIISHKHKFIFVKTRKTAGTSIEIALSAICGGEDIITPLPPKYELIRQELTGKSFQNCFKSGHEYSSDRFDNMQETHEMKQNLLFRTHKSARFIKRNLPGTTWNRYFKFCFERNPWDKVISMYYERYSATGKKTLSEFINSDELYGLSDWKKYFIKGQNTMDFIGRYENLADDLDKAYNMLNISERPELPHVRGNKRKDRRHYSNVLNKNEKALIAQQFSREIRYFGYRFDEQGY